MDTGDLHVVAELDLALVDGAFHWRRAGRLRGAGQRNVPFAGQQSRGRVQADPAGARQKDLAPGVQVGEVGFGAAGAVDRLHIGRELDQVARDEPRRQAQVPQQLHQQPARVAARAALELQGLLGRLHAGLHADGVGDVPVQPLVDVDQKVDGPAFAAVDLRQVVAQQRRQCFGGQVGRELLLLRLFIQEGEVLRAWLQKEVERVVYRHLDHQVDGHLEFGGRLRKHQPCLVVGERVLLPVDEVLARFDLL